MTNSKKVLGKIVDSESHLLYRVRVFNPGEYSEPLSSKDYRLGSFVGVERGEELIVGIISDTRLFHPTHLHYGPRLTVPPEENQIFAPDYVYEVGTFLYVLLLGYLREGKGVQQIPPEVLEVGQTVRLLGSEEVRAFHLDEAGGFQLRYYSILAESGIPFISSLFRAIGEQVKPLFGEEEEMIFGLLADNLTWRAVFSNSQVKTR